MGGQGVVAAARRAGAARRAALARPGGPRAPIALRAAAVLWGGWLLVTGLMFSFMAGIIHPYYTVAIAPAVAALVGARRRASCGATARRSASRATLAGGARADGRLGLVPAARRRPGSRG